MNIEDILQQMKNKLRRYYVCSGIIGLDGIYLALDSFDGENSATKIAAEFADGVKDITGLLKEIKSGRLQYLNIATDKYKIFILPIGLYSKYFCLLIIKKDGNLGKAILELEKTEKLLTKEMEQNCFI